MPVKNSYTDDIIIRVLHDVDHGDSINDVSEKYKVPIAVINDWIRKRDTQSSIEAALSAPIIDGRLHPRAVKLKDVLCKVWNRVRRYIIYSIPVLVSVIFVLVTVFAFDSKDCVSEDSTLDNISTNVIEISTKLDSVNILMITKPDSLCSETVKAINQAAEGLKKEIRIKRLPDNNKK